MKRAIGESGIGSELTEIASRLARDRDPPATQRVSLDVTEVTS